MIWSCNGGQASFEVHGRLRAGTLVRSSDLELFIHDLHLEVEVLTVGHGFNCRCFVER
jgi:hypothetical protein